MLSRPEVREVLERIDQEIEESGNAVYGAGGPDSPADDPEALEILHAFWKNDKAALASLLRVSESTIEDILNLNDFLDLFGPDEDNSNPYG